MKKLSTVPYEETKHLVKKFFQKIINLKELEQKKQLENSEIQYQLDEQNRLVEQLKMALNTSTSEFDKQKSKIEKSNKALTQQLTECNGKIATLEREISMYKEKLVKLKTSSSSNANNQFDSDSTTSLNNGFYLKSNTNGISNDSAIQDAENPNKNSSKSIKVSRKDLRRLTEEEILKRSLKTATISNNYLDNDLDNNKN